MSVTAHQILSSLFNAEDTVCLRVFADRKDDVFSGSKLNVECGKFATMEGLKRLMANNYQFSETQENIDELEQYREESDAVSATAACGMAVTILVNGVAHTSGNDATWESGTNTVTVIASKTGCTSTAYTVTVTKNGQG